MKLLIVALLLCFGCREEKTGGPIKCPFYWTIEKDGKTSHVLGTIHIAVDAKQLPKQLWDDLAASTTFISETDTSSGDIQRLIRRPAGSPSLRSELGDKHWRKLVDIVGMNAANQLDGMRSFVAVVTLMQKYVPRQVLGMDGEFHRAAINKKQVMLETGEFQIGVMEKHVGTRELKHILDDPKEYKTELVKLVSAYEGGDEAETVRLFAEQKASMKKQGYTDAEYQAMRDDMFFKRNQAWIEPIEKAHAEDKAWIAVGLGHLLGEGSVNELLAQKGYKLTRMACLAKAQ
jgi:uncharacterized protein YbaP (TraB family)